MDQATGVMFAGVGGQGIILAGELLSEAALAAGLEVKKSEVHGMAQRGGSVISHVRFGTVIASPLIPEGSADYLVAFEEMEGLRYLHLLRKGGTLVLNRQRIPTLAMLLGDEPYPEAALAGLESLPVRVSRVDGPALAAEAGNPKTVNIAVLGVLARQLAFPQELWRDVLKDRLPEKFFSVNWVAFQKGWMSPVPVRPVKPAD